jgi:uncharacterized protein (TIGR02266 family)
MEVPVRPAPEAASDATADALRRPPRFELRIPVDCSTQDMFLSNRVMNISQGGLFMASETSLPIHAEVSLLFSLPETGRTITVKGRVIWSYDIPKGTSHIVRGAGIKFVEMAAEDRAHLYECIERLAQSGGGRS